jgi:hypothetical protein
MSKELEASGIQRGVALVISREELRDWGGEIDGTAI